MIAASLMRALWLVGDHFSDVPDLEGRFVVCYPDGSLRFGYEVEGVTEFFE